MAIRAELKDTYELLIEAERILETVLPEELKKIKVYDGKWESSGSMELEQVLRYLALAKSRLNKMIEASPKLRKRKKC